MILPMRNNRLNLRLQPGEKSAIRRAARLERQTLTAFVLAAAIDRAVIVQFSQPATGRGNQGKKR